MNKKVKSRTSILHIVHILTIRTLFPIALGFDYTNLLLYVITHWKNATINDINRKKKFCK